MRPCASAPTAASQCSDRRRSCQSAKSCLRRSVAKLDEDIERRCALVVRLFRAPVFDVTLGDQLQEACAGTIVDEPDESAARRAACEELGVSLTSLERVALVWSSPGCRPSGKVSSSRPYLLAGRTGEGDGVPSEHEGITLVERALQPLANDVDRGRIADRRGGRDCSRRWIREMPRFS